MEKNPFPDLSIDSTAFLDELSGRSQCSKCSKSRKYYCYTCYVPVPEIASRVPNIQLPIKIDIIKHPSEVDGKSTAIHAGVIAPDDVTIYTYPCIPDYEDKNKVVLVFPGKDAVTLEDLASRWNVSKVQDTQGSSSLKRSLDTCENTGSAEKNGQENCCSKIRRVEEEEYRDNQRECTANEQISTPQHDAQDELSTFKNQSERQSYKDIKESRSEIEDKGKVKDQRTEARESERHKLVPGCPLERVVFVDSTWNQTKTICNDERLKGLTHVELQTRKTRFWRHQKDIPDTYLSTIEAIYYFVCDFHEYFIQSDYAGQYDNLLFFFTYMYSKIRSFYNGGEDLKAYKSRKGK